MNAFNKCSIRRSAYILTIKQMNSDVAVTFCRSFDAFQKGPLAKIHYLIFDLTAIKRI